MKKFKIILMTLTLFLSVSSAQAASSWWFATGPVAGMVLYTAELAKEEKEEEAKAKAKKKKLKKTLRKRAEAEYAHRHASHKWQ
jgi:hypothetical protein